METTRWWHVAVIGTAALLSILLLVLPLDTTNRIGGFAAMAVLVAGWFLLVGRVWRSDTVASILLTAIIITAVGVGVSFVTTFAVAQALAYPVLWRIAINVRAAVVANFALAAAVGWGFINSQGTSPGALLQAAITVVLSLAFSLAIGAWFTYVYRISDDREVLIRQLEAAQDQVAALSRDAGALSERERLARELHDTIAQDLTGLVMTVQRTRRELSAGDTAATATQLALLEELARNALADTRALVAAGASVEVDGGLVPAIERLAALFERETGLSVALELNDPPALERASQVVLLRCMQESLANVRKHSSASAVALTLETIDDSVRLRVTDDGSGFDPDTARNGFGLSGMRERLALVQGTLHIDTEPRRGTTVTASLPLTSAVKA